MKEGYDHDPGNALMKKKKRTDTTTRRMTKLTKTAIDCLEAILADEGAKTADRISAAKLAIDIAKQHTSEHAPDDSTVYVVFEGFPKEFAE